MTGYTLTARSPQGYDDTVARVRELLADAGFGVLTEIDIRATLKTKLDVDVPAQVILGACRPQLAHRALEADPSIAAMLPCNVVVREEADGVVVEAVDPQVMVGMSAAADVVGEVADDARTRLLGMLERVAADDHAAGAAANLRHPGPQVRADDQVVEVLRVALVQGELAFRADRLRRFAAPAESVARRVAHRREHLPQLGPRLLLGLARQDVDAHAEAQVALGVLPVERATGRIRIGHIRHLHVIGFVFRHKLIARDTVSNRMHDGPLRRGDVPAALGFFSRKFHNGRQTQIRF